MFFLHGGYVSSEAVPDVTRGPQRRAGSVPSGASVAAVYGGGDCAPAGASAYGLGIAVRGYGLHDAMEANQDVGHAVIGRANQRGRDFGQNDRCVPARTLRYSVLER